MEPYFDPVPLLGEARGAFLGRWADRTWLNVPGPFYGAETDNCGTGRLHARDLVLHEAGSARTWRTGTVLGRPTT